MANDSIYAYLQERDRKAEMQRIVDLTHIDLLDENPPSAFDKVFSAKFYADPKLVLLKLERHRPTVASLISEDAEIPPSKPRMRLTEDLLKDVRIGKAYNWTGIEMAMLQDMQRSDINPELKAKFEEHFFGTARSIPVSIQDKSRMLSVPIGLTGASTFTDPLTTVVFEVSYLADTVASHLPPPLTGPARWNQPLTALPLLNLRDHSDQIYQLSARPLRKRPDYIFMNYSVLLYLRETNEVKLTWLQEKGMPISDVPVLTGVNVPEADLKAMIARRVNPDSPCEVVIINSQISEEQADKTILDKVLFQANGSTDWYMFGWDGMIERAFLPCTEALLMGVASGVLLVNGQRTDKIPFRYWTEGAANWFPIVADPRMLAARKIV